MEKHVYLQIERMEKYVYLQIETMEKYVYLQSINNGEIRLSTKYKQWRNMFIYK